MKLTRTQHFPMFFFFVVVVAVVLFLSPEVTLGTKSWSILTVVWILLVDALTSVNLS